jgi:hypothetical protein
MAVFRGGGVKPVLKKWGFLHNSYVSHVAPSHREKKDKVSGKEKASIFNVLRSALLFLFYGAYVASLARS